MSTNILAMGNCGIWRLGLYRQRCFCKICQERLWMGESTFKYYFKVREHYKEKHPEFFHKFFKR